MTTANTVNALEMSDEEFAKLDFYSSTSEPVSSDTDSTSNSDASLETEREVEEVVSEESTAKEITDSDDDVEDVAVKSTTDEKVDKPVEKAKSIMGDSTTTVEKLDEVAAEDVVINYEDVGKRIFKPFKANGKQIQVKSVDDALNLMKMGANYNKKMAALKPNVKFLKMLENNNLLSEEKLNYLIDLDKKNPEAIKKLVKEGGLDPQEMDLEIPNEYKPNTYTVSDTDVELDSVLDEIKDTASFNTTIDVIGNKWDIASRGVIANQPGLIKIINGHIESGIYQQIQNTIDSERMFGRLTGLSDLEAYRQVGEALNNSGKLTNGISPQTKPATPIAPKTKTLDSDELKNRKKAASSTKHVAAPAKQQFNPLSLSDEEFAKLSISDYI